MENFNIKEKRSKNFKDSEVNLLLDLVNKYKQTLECKKTDAVSARDKDRVWRLIEDEFNTQSGIFYRDAKALRGKYDNLKKTTKRKFADEKKYVMGTGGGPSIKTDISDVELKVKDIIGNTTVLGQDSLFDSDAIQLQPVALFSGIDLTNAEVQFEEEVTDAPLMLDISPNIVIQESTSSGHFSVNDSPRKAENKVPVSPRKLPVSPFNMRDLRTKTSTPLAIRKKKSPLDKSVAGKKIESVGTAKEELLEIQKVLYKKQCDYLDEEHTLKIKCLEAEHLKKIQLLDLDIEKKRLEISLLNKQLNM